MIMSKPCDIYNPMSVMSYKLYTWAGTCRSHNRIDTSPTMMLLACIIWHGWKLNLKISLLYIAHEVSL